VIIEPAGRDELLGLMQETYGSAMSATEFDWWFDRNPAGPRVLSGARDEQGVRLGVLAMSYARMSQGLSAFAVHAVTTPAARGRGVFSELELHNEEEARQGGATWALGFTNPQAGPILVGKLGWEDVTSLRVWVRPKRLRRRSGGGLRVDARCPPFDAGHERPPVGQQIVKDVRYLDWRYADSPRPYLRVDGEGGGWAIVTHAHWHGFSSAVVCDAFGPGLSGLLRRGLRAVDADVAVAIVNRGEERAYLAAGFIPSPRAIRFIGKRLSGDAPTLPKQRDAWRFSLGDLDFF
jgi:GNAT superfamily N-acetyltransferase